MKKWVSLFLILLVPNVLRQIVYYVAQLSLGTAAFIASFETQVIFSLGTFPWIGIGQEILIGVVYTALFFFRRPTQLFAYGWIGDAFIDFVMVACFILFGTTPLLALGLGPIARFVVREVVLGYLLIGIPLTLKQISMKKWSIVCSCFGLVVLLLAIVL